MLTSAFLRAAELEKAKFHGRNLPFTIFGFCSNAQDFWVSLQEIRKENPNDTEGADEITISFERKMAGGIVDDFGKFRSLDDLTSPEKLKHVRLDYRLPNFILCDCLQGCFDGEGWGIIYVSFGSPFSAVSKPNFSSKHAFRSFSMFSMDYVFYTFLHRSPLKM